MTVQIQSGYLPAQPLCNARIAHSRNWVTGTPSVTGTAVGYFSDAPNDTLTYERWKPDALPAVWQLNDVSGDVNYCAIAAHTCGSDGVIVSVEYWDGTSWMPIDSVAPTDDSPIMFLFQTVSSDMLRVLFTGSVAPEVGVLKFGIVLELPDQIFSGHVPVSLGRRTVLRSNYSDTGEFLGRTRQRSFQETAFSWDKLPRAWIDAWWPDLQRAIESEPFWIAWRPSSFQDVAFAQVDEVPIPSFTGMRDFMAAEFSVRALGVD